MAVSSNPNNGQTITHIVSFRDAEGVVRCPTHQEPALSLLNRPLHSGFYKCGHSPEIDRCRFFKWADDPSVAEPPKANTSDASEEDLPVQSVENARLSTKRPYPGNEEGPSTPMPKRIHTTPGSQSDLTPAQREKRLAAIQAATGPQSGESSSQESTETPTRPPKRNVAGTFAQPQFRPHGIQQAMGERQDQTHAMDADEEELAFWGSSSLHQSQDDGRSEVSVARYLSSGSSTSNRLPDGESEIAPAHESEELMPDLCASEPEPRIGSISTPRGRSTHAHSGNEQRERTMLLTPPPSSHPEHNERYGQAARVSDARYTPTKSKGKEREIPTSGSQWPPIQSDPDNLFDDSSETSSYSDSDAPAFTVAKGDPIALLRALSKIPDHLTSLKQKNRKAVKCIKKKNQRIAELETRMRTLEDELERERQQRI
ncbi:unnamed protein product [Somion occarium]|uniref:Zinc finger GRF-type domain-containing protein n=1 Tax=Somion occarium TaxID=3059160 RepID=A0ABP1DG79_9APHY